MAEVRRQEEALETFMKMLTSGHRYSKSIVHQRHRGGWSACMIVNNRMFTTDIYRKRRGGSRSRAGRSGNSVNAEENVQLNDLLLSGVNLNNFPTGMSFQPQTDRQHQYHPCWVSFQSYGVYHIIANFVIYLSGMESCILIICASIIFV